MADIEIKGGTLMKRSRNRSALSSMTGVNWQLRRISLTETRIAYGTVDGPPKDFVPINSSTTAHVEPSQGDKEFIFRINTGSDELILNALSEEDRKEWLAAVKIAINPPAPPSTGDAQADKLAAQLERTRLENARAAEAAAHAALSNMSVGVPSMGMPSVGMPSAGGLLGAAGGALLNAAAAKAAEEAAAAVKAAAEKAKLNAKLKVPVACQKKLSTESSLHARYIWINEVNKEFHWGKTDDITKSKCISITKNVKSVKSNADINEPNFTIELVDAESVFSGGLFSSVPSSIDIVLDDSSINKGFIAFITDLKK